MNSVYMKMRLVSIGVVAATSIVAGMVAIWHVAPRDVMDATPTWVYVAILALLVCPIITIAAWSWDRKNSQRELLEIEANGDKAERDAKRSGPVVSTAPPLPPTPEPASVCGVSSRRIPRGSRHRAIRHAAK